MDITILFTTVIDHGGEKYAAAYKSNQLATFYRGASIDDDHRMHPMSPITRALRKEFFARFPVHQTPR